MSETIPYANLLILALVAGFILLRLRGILGKDLGNDQPNFFNRAPIEKTDRDQPIVQLHEKLLKPKPKEEADPYLAALGDTPVASGLKRIKEEDPEFSASEFLEGAKLAFEMVFDAYVKGDKDTLRMLLSDALYKEFSGEVDSRAGEENKRETTLVSILGKDITQARLEGTTAHIGVRFISEQVSVMRNPQGEIVGGDPSALQHIEDEWVFERNTHSKNPNWKIIET